MEQLTTFRTLTLEIDGRRFTYAAPMGDKDPMEMTLGEWRAYPYLTSIAMLDLIPGNREIPMEKDQ